MTSYIPKSREYRGSDCSGTDGTTSRTLTLESTSVIDGMTIIVNGTGLHYGASADYTFASAVITFNNAVFDTDYIDITYFYLAVSSGISNGYCTPEEVFDFMQLSLEIPDYDNATTTKETIGQADGTTSTTYYLDHNKVIDGTQVIFYGSGETTITYLTETTDYTFNNERGSFALTTTGASTGATANLYATYKYTSTWKNIAVQDLINAKTSFLLDLLDKDFRDNYVVVNEERPGKGAYDRLYKPDNCPVHVFKGQLNGAVGSTATTFVLDNTTGLIIGDYCSIEDEAVLVTAVTNATDIVVTRGVLDTSGAVHADNTLLTNTFVEISNSPIGSAPTWVNLQYGSQFQVDSDTGSVQILHVNAGDRNNVTADVYPLHHIFSRFRRTYTYGVSSVPDDIKQLCILMVAKEMFNSQVLNALSRGVDGFNTEGFSYINQSIKDLIAKNKRLVIDGN